MNTIFIGSHPDDVELGCGATIAKHVSKGDKVFVMVLTKGERGKHFWEFFDKSMEILSIDKKNTICLEIPDGLVKNDWKTINDIENIIVKEKIERVYTHSLNETHQDHRNCHLATIAASRRVHQILFYEGPSTITITKNFFVKIEENFLQKKIDSLTCYEGQYPKSFNIKTLEALAITNGHLMSREFCFAEAFEIGRFTEL
jgi:LmbE family N-acetylglucosaminyl deacetylase